MGTLGEPAVSMRKIPTVDLVPEQALTRSGSFLVGTFPFVSLDPTGTAVSRHRNNWRLCVSVISVYSEDTRAYSSYMFQLSSPRVRQTTEGTEFTF